MSVSNSSDFTRTRDQLISRALRVCGVLKAGETPGAQVVTDTAEALNSMVKRWMRKDGIRAWTVTEATLFPQAEQVRYELGTSSTDHATETYYQTRVSADEASGQTIISVDDTNSITANDHIGIVVDDGSVHWSTVASKTSSTVTINDALDDGATTGNAVFNYTTKIVRPIKIVDARRYSVSSQNDTPLPSMLARSDYNALPNKVQTGAINQAFYDPRRSDQTGLLYIWQPLLAVTDLLKFTYHRPIMDFDAAGDNPDLPTEWVDAIVYNLAVSIAPEYDVPADRMQIIALQAASYLEDVQGDDREQESYYFGVDMMG